MPGGARAGLRVERLTADGWRTWRALRLAALADAPDAFLSRLADWQGDNDTEARWRARIESPGSVCLVCRDGVVPVGMVSADPDRDGRPVTWLLSLWVVPDARGSGVVEALVESVAAIARERRHHQVLLEVNETNARAAAAYRRLGFVPTGEVREVGGHREHTWSRSLTP